MWRRTRVVLHILNAAALCYLGWTLLSRHAATQRWIDSQKPTDDPAARAAFVKTYGGSELKILQFYARDGEMVDGQSTVLCYGVLNATVVRIQPALEGVGPSLNRCVAVTPAPGVTKYVLTAEGVDGRAVSESLAVAVRPDEATAPRITSFRVVNHRVDGGRSVYLLAFSDVNGQEVSIEPEVFPVLRGAPSGQFWVAPEGATTYTLTVRGSRGRVARQRLLVGNPK